ncbi:MAG: helix-turn-helix transcriptional regulator [Phycisphaerae bacterium]|nr:helix-turn-helix transcriptional regulator [Phycisphaerae bacterium]
MTYDFSIIRHIRKKLGLTIYGLSEKCGVSYVALSKLERNLGNPELKTLDRIARALGVQTHNLLALAEHDRPQVVAAERIVDENGIHFHRASFDGIHVSQVTARAGALVCAEHEHRDDYEVCFVLKGKVKLTVRNSEYEILPGQAVRFDCIFEHRYEAVEDSEVFHVVTRK